MPGFKNVGGPRFLGAGKEKKKRFPGYQKPTKKYPGRGSVQLPDKKAMPNARRPLPSTPKEGSGSRLRPGVHAPGRPSYEETAGRMRDAMYRNPPQPVKPSATPDIKSWEDRNRSNNKTKLNP
jgi:hypothetical protein